MTTIQKGKATTLKSTFSRQTEVSTDIKATPSIIWALLTNASDYPRWNSTIVSIEGNIKPGEKIKLKSTLDAKRTFKLKVMDFETDKKLSWGDAMGKRVYSLSLGSNGVVTFTMNEKIGGPLFPLFAKMIPSFDNSFELFASDLKKRSRDNNEF